MIGARRRCDPRETVAMCWPSYHTGGFILAQLIWPLSRLRGAASLRLLGYAVSTPIAPVTAGAAPAHPRTRNGKGKDSGSVKGWSALAAILLGQVLYLILSEQAKRRQLTLFTTREKRCKIPEGIASQHHIVDRPPAIEPEDGQWEAQKLLLKRRVGRTTQYLVKWQGYPPHENTWEKKE